MKKQRIKSDHCTNCGRQLPQQENYCPDCGQENDNKRQSFSHVVVHTLETILHIDSKVLLTIRPLLFKPGFLTTEFLKGKRKSYLDPIRMFFSLVIAYFLLSAFAEKIMGTDHEQVASPREIKSSLEAGDTTISFGEFPVDFTIKSEDMVDSVDESSKNYSHIAQLADSGITNVEQVLDSLGKEKTFWNKFYYSQLIKTIQLDGTEFQHYIKSKLAWMIFAIMPVFALLLLLFFRRSGYFYIDHLMFSCHLHSFVFLVSSIGLIIELITGWETSLVIVPVVMVYFVMALKKVYENSTAKTILKSVLLFLSYIASLALTSFIILVLLFIFF